MKEDKMLPRDLISEKIDMLQRGRAANSAHTLASLIHTLWTQNTRQCKNPMHS